MNRRAAHVGRWALAGLLFLGGAAWAGEAAETEGRARGQATAPVTLIEYSDFTCGYCLKFFRETWPRLQAQYVESGKLRFLYRDYPRADRGPGLDAAVAARCGGAQGKYWAMHDRLFAAGGRLEKAVFMQQAAAIGLDQPAFERCLKEGKYLASIFDDKQEATRWGFRGTPGFILMHTVGGATDKEPAIAIPGAFPFEMFAEEIDRLLASAPRENNGPRAE